MFAFLKKKKIHQAQINDVAIEVNTKETVLASALQQGLPMAHSCRAGGCGSCKCQLLEGEIKALTDFSYILNADELDNNFILACQSVPKTDLKIQANLSAQLNQAQEVQGRVVAQEPLTHDITRLRLRMDNHLNYQAGQYADLAIESLPDTFRSFSFASPAHSNGQLEFFIRTVKGGVFTEYLQHNSLVGQSVTVRGPHGDFYLRTGSAPLLFIAGGSGLAPIKAILEEAQQQGVQRDAVVLFGARQQRELYLLDELTELGKRWQGSFQLIAALNEEPTDSNWRGARGLITEHIAAVWQPEMHAYLCGPPPMVDAASDTLIQLGMTADNIHSDRFLTNHQIK